jgi:hypothetical protein
MKNLFTLFVAFFISLMGLNATNLSGWLYIDSLAIKENSGATIANYQLKLTLNTADLVQAGKLNADGSDLRFSGDKVGTISYPYWIESGVNTSSTIVWVKIPQLAALSTQKLYFLYGNPSAIALSSIPNTFSSIQSADNQYSKSNISVAIGASPNTVRGYRFSPNDDILVTQFGKCEPNGTPRWITLFDFNSTTKLEQIQVNDVEITYCYNNLPNPRWLTKNNQYVITIQQGNTDSYYFTTSIKASDFNSYITYYDLRYDDGDKDKFPTLAAPGRFYGFPDFNFYFKNTVTPAPTYSGYNISSTSFVHDNVAAIYPNPTSDFINLSSKEGIQSISITNLAGNTVWSGSAAEFPINVSSFAKGIYLVNMVSADGVKTEKVVVK